MQHKRVAAAAVAFFRMRKDGVPQACGTLIMPHAEIVQNIRQKRTHDFLFVIVVLFSAVVAVAGRCVPCLVVMTVPPVCTEQTYNLWKINSHVYAVDVVVVVVIVDDILRAIGEAKSLN